MKWWHFCTSSGEAEEVSEQEASALEARGEIVTNNPFTAMGWEKN